MTPMAQWLVTQGSNQFSVDGLAQLKKLASAGDLRGGDLIQPPGASDWMYAIEVPGLEDLLPPEEEEELVSSGGNTRVLAAIFAVVLVAFGSAAFYYSQQLPDGNEVLIGRGGLTYSQMIVTEPNQVLLSDANTSAGTVAALPKDSVLELLAKRGDFYRARTQDNAEGWVDQGAVIPMYQLGGEDVREEFDPLYNPDRYVNVANASWLPMPEATKDEDVEGHITIFQFFIHNQSKYRMDNLVIEAVIKDAKGSELERVEIPVEGEINPNAGSMVGTLSPAEDAEEDAEPRLLTTHSFQEMAKTDPDLQLRYSEGVEVLMQTDKFTNANIEIVELRAIPDDEAAEVVSGRG